MNNPSSINIRLATENDAVSIATIHVSSWQKIYSGHIPDTILNNLSIEKRKQKWHELLKNKVTILVIEKNNVIVGFASLCPSRDEDTDPNNCGEISAIYLDPSVWRQKLGEKLCLAALSKLEEMGFVEAIVWVLSENMQARKFYEAMGFKNSGKTKIATLSTCTLGVVSGEKATENANITIHEVRYIKNTSSQNCGV